jgi:hypothetical protein
MDTFQKQTQETRQNCTSLIDKQKIKYVLQMKPQAPLLNAQLKIHKHNFPIRMVVNNIQAPTYKITKFPNEQLQKIL